MGKVKTVTVCDICDINPPVSVIKLGAGAIGAASRYGSGSTKIMRLRHHKTDWKLKDASKGWSLKRL
jgi:hypothetical protein